MFWVCVQYSDGTRVHHVFRQCGVFIDALDCDPPVLRVHGDTICGTSFSAPSGSADRVDTMWGVIAGVLEDLRMQPMDACKKCQAERERLAAGGRPVYADEGGN